MIIDKKSTTYYIVRYSVQILMMEDRMVSNALFFAKSLVEESMIFRRVEQVSYIMMLDETEERNARRI